jgi:hypothetical protein
MGLWQMLGLFAYIIFLLVFMPILLLWSGKFAKYCAQRKPDVIGFPMAQPKIKRDEIPPSTALDE